MACQKTTAGAPVRGLLRNEKEAQHMSDTILVTGGVGFIGSAVVRRLLAQTGARVVNVDKMTYAANPRTLAAFEPFSQHVHERVDIVNREEVRRVFRQYRPSHVIHLAAESHVDRSIDGPEDFIRTNILGSYTLLEEASAYWRELGGASRDAFRFINVSTDEVYGSLGAEGLFREDTAYRPNSPYAASKASADHLARAWHKTYGLPVVISNCSNNYGPYQFPEKLIPLMITNAVAGRPLPVYGAGENVRDWLYVEDHAAALVCLLREGRVGEKYNIGGNAERRNIDLVNTLCAVLDRLLPQSPFRPFRNLIQFVADRPGHDLRYAVDSAKMQRETGWRPAETLDSGLEKTVRWYLDNHDWCEAVSASVYDGRRLGLGAP